jgi:hypothetical protein
MWRALWRATPVLLAMTVILWGVGRGSTLYKLGVEESALERESHLGDVADDAVAPDSGGLQPAIDIHLERVGDEAASGLMARLSALWGIFAAKDVVIVLVAVIGCIWGVKWFRHRRLMRFLDETARRKQEIEAYLDGNAHAPTAPIAGDTAVPAHGSAVLHEAPQRPSRPEIIESPFPGDRELQEGLASANALLASHLATQLALQGTTASPEQTVRLLRKASTALMLKMRGSSHELDDPDAYELAAEMGRETRRLITGTPQYLTDPQFQRVGDALIEVIRVLDEGAEGFSWACDTIEGFVLGVQDVQVVRDDARSFADAHGPMSRPIGAVTSPGFLKPPLPTGDTGEMDLLQVAGLGDGMERETSATFLDRILAQRKDRDQD